METNRARRVVLFFSSAAAALLGLVFAVSAGATFPGEPGPMLINEGRDIVAVDPDTGDSRKIIEVGNANYGATGTADGLHFVYIGGEFDNNTIFIRSLANTNKGYKGRAIFSRSQSGHPNSLGMRALDLAAGKGRIFFSAVAGGYTRHNNGHRIEIYSIGRDGSGLKRLTNNRRFDNEPAVSPDGKRIAFARRTSRNAHIWIMNSDGTGQRQLTHGKGWERLPTFSPDGRRILYTGQVPRDGLNRWESAELFTASSKDGRHRTRLTHDRRFDLYSAFSPNGRAVAYVTGSGHYNVNILNLNNGRTRLAYKSNYGGGITSLTWGPKP